MSDKKALFVSYHFPPIKTAAVARVTGFIKYLVAGGWKISVLTVRESPRERMDPATLERIPPGVDVVRTGSLEADGVLNRVRGPRRAVSGTPVRSTTAGGGPGKTRALENLWKAPLRVIYKAWIFPDKQAGWAWHLFFALRRRIRNGRHQLVVSSSPPHSSQIAIAVLKSFTRFTWIADFRDGWTAPAYREWSTRFQAWMARRLERFVLERCDHIIAVSEGNRRKLLETFPFLPEDKVTVVISGFDVSLPVRDVEVDGEETACDIMYLGELYTEAVDVLLPALSIVRRKSPVNPPRIFVYGFIEDQDLARIRERSLDDVIVYRGMVSWDRSIHLMRRARSLLLVLPHSAGGSVTVPSKLFSYLFAGPPIIALGPAGDAATIIEDVGAGAVISARDAEGVAEGIVDFVQTNREGHWRSKRNDDRLQAYTMEAAAAKLDRVLTGALDG